MQTWISGGIVSVSPCLFSRGFHTADEGHCIVLLLGCHLAGCDGLVLRAVGGSVRSPHGVGQANLVTFAMGMRTMKRNTITSRWFSLRSRRA